MPGRNLTELPAFVPGSGNVNVVVENPAGSRVKAAYDPELDIFHLSYVLPKGSAFPFEFGFIPSTIAEDGDPLDIMVLLDVPTSTGCVLTARAIGAIEAEQTQDGRTFRNDRLIGVAIAGHQYSEVRSLGELDQRTLDEVESFFVSYNRMRGRVFEPIRRAPSTTAIDLIHRAMDRRAAKMS
jgi:inorganic pyrophosphatase